MRDWGLPRWYAFFPASLLVASSSGVFAVLAPGATIAIGTPFGGPLYFLLAFVAVIGALGIAPSTGGSSAFRTTAQWMDHVTGLGVVLVALTCLATPVGGLVAHHMPGSRRLGIVAMYGYGREILFLASAVAGLWIFAAIRDRRGASRSVRLRHDLEFMGQSCRRDGDSPARDRPDHLREARGVVTDAPGRIGPDAYRRAVLVSLCIFPIGLLSFPFLAAGASSVCFDPVSGCGALLAIAYPIFVPLLASVVGVPLLVLTIRRIQNWGAPWWYVFLPVLGAIATHPLSPTGLVACLGSMAALCLAPSGSGTEPEGEPRLPTDHVTALAIALLTMVGLADRMGPTLFHLDRLVVYPAFLAAFVTVFFWIVAALRGRRNAAAIPTSA